MITRRRPRNQFTHLLAFIIAFGSLTACGGSDGGSSGALSVYPLSTEVDPADIARFDATSGTDSADPVEWSVVESGGGTIDSLGRYIAPDAEGTFHVVATSSTLQAEQVAVVTVVKKGMRVNVSPSVATVTPGATLTLHAKITGAGTLSDAVTWSVAESAGGTVSSTGLYAAPATAGTYHVVATSVADPARTAFAAITVVDAPTPEPSPMVVTVRLTPVSASLETGETAQLSANVTGTSDAAVTWSVSQGADGGTVSSTGLYTAPAAAGTYHVVATSVADPSKSATAMVTVAAPPTPEPPSTTPPTPEPPSTTPPTPEPPSTLPPTGADATGWSVTKAPPAMSNPITITLPGNYLSTVYSSFCSGPGYVLNLNDGQDYVIRANAPLRYPIRITGGNNVRIVGIEMDLSNADSECTAAGESPIYVPGSHAIRVDNIGTTFFEGLYIDLGNNVADVLVVRNKIGGYDALNKGYTEAQARGAHDIVIQNSVIRGYQSGPDPVRDEHADFIQTQGIYEIFRDITIENVTVDSLSEGAIFLARGGYPLANSITMRNFDYRIDARWTPTVTGGPVMHTAKAFSYSNVFLGVDVVREYTVNTQCGTGCVQPCNGSEGIFCPTTPSSRGFTDRFASPGTAGASNAWTGVNYVSPHD